MYFREKNTNIKNNNSNIDVFTDPNYDKKINDEGKINYCKSQ